MVSNLRPSNPVRPPAPSGTDLAALMREGRTRLGMGWNRLKVAAGSTSGGFFIPYRYARELQPPATPYPAVEALLHARDELFRGFVTAMATHLPVYQGFGRDDRDPTWGRSMFPAFDGAAAYTLVRQVRPSRIIEIGSGNSTRFMARALRDGGIDCAFTCIDPAPRIPVEGLGVTPIPRLLTETDADLCADLEPDDILFIDSSHILLPGMDVDIEFNRIFPVLKPGVLVHLHDIFLPYDYPATMRRWSFSEQNALIGWIVSGYFDVVFPAHYVRRVHTDLIEAEFSQQFPPLVHSRPGSIWLRRAGSAVA
jgi:hypothetical protein